MKLIFDAGHIHTEEEAAEFLDRCLDTVLEAQNEVPKLAGSRCFDTSSESWKRATKYHSAYNAVKKYLKGKGLFWEESDGESIFA